jgi:aspartate/methionine/tyrosine aminotransferase
LPYTIRPSLAAVAAPPISEAFRWIPEDTGGRPFIQLSQAVPGYPPARALQDHLAGLTGLHETSLYTDILGVAELRKALADDVAKDYTTRLSYDNIAITAGGNQAFCLAILALAQPGDNVILCEPYFFNHQMWLEMNGIEVRLIPCSAGMGMLPDADEALRTADARTRAIVLVSPNNPTGAIYPPDLLSRFFDAAAQADSALIIDETYKDFRTQDRPAHDLFQRARWDETFIHLYSFSKVFSLTGYRVGALAASPRLVEEIEKVMDCVAICAPRIAQDAALFGLRNLAEWKRRRQVDNARRLTAFREALSHPELRYELVSSGAFFGYLRHPFAGRGSFDVARRLARQHGILVLPGAMFGPNQERYLRVAFANVEADVMPEVARRLIESQSVL